MILSGAAALYWPASLATMNQGPLMVLLLAFIMLCMGLTLTAVTSPCFIPPIRIPADYHAVINPLFLGVFLGTALACVALMVSAIVRWHEPEAIYLLVGGALYLFGTFFCDDGV